MYLVKTAGELYIPVSECSEKSMHYASKSIGPIATSAKPKNPALPYLKRLLRKLRDRSDDPDEPDERTNLVYNGSNSLDLYLPILLDEPFDFFVASGFNGTAKRFSYRHKQIFTEGERLTKLQKTGHLFGADACYLELTHLGSLGIRLVDRDDYDAVELFEEKIYLEERENFRKELKSYLINTETVLDDLFTTSVLLSVASSEEPIDQYDLLEVIRAERDVYRCNCSFGESYELRRALHELTSRGFLEEVGDRYTVASGHVKSTEEPKEISYDPNQMSLDFDW